MHIKRQTFNKRWPIPRKGKKYIVNPSHSKKSGIPILIILRDVLGIVKTRKEAKYILNDNQVLLNNKVIKKDNSAVMLFDIFSINKLNKSYRLGISQKGKFVLEQSDKPAKEKICRVIGKKIIKKNKIQLNLHDGRNVLAENKINVGDSIVLNFEKKAITKHLPLKEGSEVLIISGKHVGRKGEIKGIKEKQKLFIIETEGKKIDMKNKNLMVIK